MTVIWVLTILCFSASVVGAITTWQVTRDVCQMQARLREGIRRGDALLIQSWRNASEIQREAVRRDDPQTAKYIAAVMKARHVEAPVDEQRRLAAALIAASLRTEQFN